MKANFRKDVKRLIEDHVTQMHLAEMPGEVVQKLILLPGCRDEPVKREKACSQSSSLAFASAFATANGCVSGGVGGTMDYSGVLSDISQVTLNTDVIAGKVASLLLLRGLV